MSHFTVKNISICPRLPRVEKANGPRSGFRLRGRLLSFIVLLLSLMQSVAWGQTVLIDPAGAGGFELGNTLTLNGWTAVNGTQPNYWMVGTATKYAGNNCAYITNNASANQYSNGSTSTVHFYRDISVPSGERLITLSFYFKGTGEAGWDRLLVFTAPTSVTPVAGTPASNSTTMTGAQLIYMQDVTISNYTQVTTILSPSFAGNTFRLIFTWQNDDNTGTNPPASVDDVRVSSQAADAFTTTGTSSVTIPSNAISVTGYLWGAGGGGSNEAIGDAAGGGGGGAFTKGKIENLIPGQSLSVIVGAGGSAGSPTSSPGNYSRITYNTNSIQANGGLSTDTRLGGAGGTAQTLGGIIEAAYAGGTGGNGRSAAIGSEGGGGGGGSAFPYANGGSGGSTNSSTGGIEGNGNGIGGRAGDGDGSPDAVGGLSPGGGGGGHGEDGETSKAGANGQIILVWTYETCINPSNGGTIASAQTICSGGDPGAFTNAAGASGHTGTLEYKWQYSTSNNPYSWNDITSSNSDVFDATTLTTTTWYRRLARVTCKSDWSGAAVSNVLEVTVNAQPVSGTLTPTPAAGAVCDGANVSASATAGTGGAGTVTDVLQYRFDGGTWNNYTSGTNLSTTGHTSVDIQTYRTATGTGCTSSTPVMASWTVSPQPLPGTLTPTPAAGGVCTGTNVSAVATIGSDGVGTMDVLQYQFDNSGTWITYTSGSPLSTTGHTSVDIRTYRTANGPGCTTSEDTKVTWTVNALPTFSISKTDITCFDANNGTITIKASGGSGGYQYSLTGDAYTGAYVSGNVFTGLKPNIQYTIKVKDSNQCEQTNCTITNP